MTLGNEFMTGKFSQLIVLRPTNGLLHWNNEFSRSARRRGAENTISALVQLRCEQFALFEVERRLVLQGFVTGNCAAFFTHFDVHCSAFPRSQMQLNIMQVITLGAENTEHLSKVNGVLHTRSEWEQLESFKFICKSLSGKPLEEFLKTSSVKRISKSKNFCAQFNWNQKTFCANLFIMI